MSDVIPKKIGRYPVVGHLGSGGMGDVFLAEDTTLGRRVAIKLLPPSTDPSGARRFVQEARLAAALNHPNIAQIFEIVDDGTTFIAMEYVEGDALSARVQHGSIAAGEVIDIGIQMFDALEEAHGRGIVHRDLKPANIIITARGRIKLLDFGLAKMISPAAGPSPTQLDTEPGLILGTVHYMSPEQALGREVDARTDIFSSGVVLYELVTGRLPFVGASTTETLDRIVHAQPESISRLNYGAPAELERIIRKALEKEPARRYQTARDALIDLNNLKRDSDSGAVRARPARGIKRGRKSIDSIAVLPLATPGAPELEYLADGITESVINALSHLPKLKVMARSTVFRFKGRDVSPQSVGSELGVRAVLVGRLRPVGDALMIAAELVDAADGSHIWGGQFQRAIADAFTLQEQAAAEIADQLRPRLTPAERKRIVKRHTANPVAFEAYLKGRYQLAKRTTDGFTKAVAFFEQAIGQDHSYALAYAGLADCWTLLSAAAYGEPSARTMARAREAAEQAIALDDTLVEAHAALGFVRFRIDWAWDAAEQALRRAATLNAGFAPAHHRLALLLSALGRHDEALASIQLANELDPLSLIINTAVGRVLHFQRRYEAAIDQIRQTLDLDAQFGQAHFDLGMSYAALGRYDEAISEFETTMSPGDPRSVTLAVLGHVCGAAGRTSKAEETLTELERRYRRGEASSYDVSLVLVGLGRTDEALDWLERACDARSGLLVFLKVEPMFDGIRDQPRFTELMRRLHL
jgi:serine/threonine protein kinase/Tfp pilus assembly protein PilF